MHTWKVVAALSVLAATSALLGSFSSGLFLWGKAVALVGGSLLGVVAGLALGRRLVGNAEKGAPFEEESGLYSWGFLMRTLKLQVGCSRRYGQPTSLMVVQINGSLLHQEREAVTVAVARHVQALCRTTDLIACDGNERVVALLSWTPEQPVLELAHRILASLRMEGAVQGKVGVGFASWQTGFSPEALLERACACAQHSLDLDGTRVVGPTGPQPILPPYQ